MEITSSLNFEKPNNMKTCSITLNLNNNEELIKKRIKTDIDNFDLKLFPISLQKPKYIPKLLSNPKDSFVYVIWRTRRIVCLLVAISSMNWRSCCRQASCGSPNQPLSTWIESTRLRRISLHRAWWNFREARKGQW